MFPTVISGADVPGEGQMSGHGSPSEHCPVTTISVCHYSNFDVTLSTP